MRLGFPGCALWEAKAHPGHILYFQGAPWAIFSFPRRTLAYQGAPWAIFVFQGAPWLVKVHLGTSRCTLAHLGTSRRCTLGAKAHPGKPRRTLAPFCVSKVHLGRILYFQGAPWHIKAHLGTARRTLAHQGAPGEDGNAKVDLGKVAPTSGAPGGEKLNHWWVPPEVDRAARSSRWHGHFHCPQHLGGASYLDTHTSKPELPVSITVRRFW